MTSEVSVLLVTFNRPDCTQKVLARILEVKPDRLFIFSDAARPEKEGEELLVKQCRALFENLNISWNCKVEKWFMDNNMGCGRGVSYAITKAFQKVDKLIILEDDCLPHFSFFDYCKYMLDKYELEESVMHISGTRWNEEFDTGNSDHFYSTIGHIWGWATWRRSWKKYDYEMKEWKGYNKRATIEYMGNKKVGEFWNKKIEYAYNNPQSLNTWDYQWQFALILNKGIAINPKVNLVSNIGVAGAHGNGCTVNLFKQMQPWKLNSNNGTNEITPMLQFDKYHIERHFMSKGPIMKRVVKKIKKIINYK